MKRYEMIMDYLYKQIENGIWNEGDQIDTEEALAQQFSCSRPTVRQAMTALVQKGYLRRVSGKGTFVTHPKITQEYTHFLESYDLTMKKQGLIPKTEVLDLHVEPADPFIQEKLHLKPKETVYCLKRLRYAGKEKQPLLLTEVYLPCRLVMGLERYDFEQCSLYSVLDEYGVRPQHAIRYIEAQLPDARTAAILQIPRQEPIQLITSIGSIRREDGGEIPVEYSHSCYPSSRNKFIIEIQSK